MLKKRILIADDDAGLREALRILLDQEGYIVEETAVAADLASRMTDASDGKPELILLDLVMPDANGMDVLRTLRDSLPAPLPVIVITGHGSARLTIEAMQLGAYDYIAKPFDVDEVVHTINRYFEWRALSDDVTALAEQLGRRDPADTLVGHSSSMLDIYKTIGRIARSDSTVLISGETGTGKELVATIIHQASPFARGPLVKVNCAALPETLLESELFGHEKGAFTGAIAQRKGRFEMANKGSIFLDEIGEMTLSTQRKLLRVLQEREFERVGGSATVKVDTRVIAATNRDLAIEVSEGRFREDLFYRLNVINIELPPLRNRNDDIPELVEHFLDKHRYTPRSSPARISQAALNQLMAYEWPGNVRELENVVERAVIFAAGGIVDESHINFASAGGGVPINVQRRLREGCGLKEIVAEVEKKAVWEAMKLSGDDASAAASMLGVPQAEMKQLLARADEEDDA
ncbi:MAG: sigma-54-dependent Fis family transcriptional regulator [Thermomicrobiales bacterium]|nr:sigma-54-dependent Fis family transcriptional regulator [Thermomicrobiales bacterium]